MNGFVIVPRVILENEAICKDAEHIGLYVYLLSKVSYTENSYTIWNGKGINLKIGQMVTTIRTLADETGINQTKITRILSLFKKWNILGTITEGRKTLITIDSRMISNLLAGTNLEHFWNDRQENKDEKEKSSKREKEENKEIIKKEIPPISPKGLEEFEEFWKAYPKKVGKRYARKCFLKLNVNKELLKKMLETLSWQKNSRDWQRENGKYIPNPSTWLNQGRWDDEDINENRFREQKFGVYL